MGTFYKHPYSSSSYHSSEQCIAVHAWLPSLLGEKSYSL